MGSYRDDRHVLTERIAELEAELEALRTRVTELEATEARAEELEREVSTLRGRLARRPATNRAPAAVIGISAGVLVAGAIAALTLRSAPPPTAVMVPPPIPDAPKPPPKPATPEPPRMPEVAPSCTCQGDRQVGLTYIEGATMSFGANVTRFVTWGLRVTSAAAGTAALDLQPDVASVPPPRVEGGEIELAMACLPDRVVFAHGQRASAWSFDDGKELWSAPLPAPVGASHRGDLAVTCKRLEVDAKGRIVVPHAGGKTLLSAADGALAR